LVRFPSLNHAGITWKRTIALLERTTYFDAPESRCHSWLSEERIQKERSRPTRSASLIRIEFKLLLLRTAIYRLIEFLDEIGSPDKSAFLGKASALLFPVNWPERFGAVMIESMACGTPVIAYRNGSGPEIVDQGISGCGT
jgi:glycosyltransferase involved in cell wall biosynthesis